MGNAFGSSICGDYGDERKDPSAPFGVFMADGAAPAGISPALRSAPEKFDNARELDAPSTTDEFGNGTAWSFVEEKLKRFALRRAVGWRDVLKHEMEGKFEKLTLSPDYTWWTYEELMDHVVALSSGLPVAKGDAVLIFAETQRDWMVTALACFRIGCIVVTAYATLGEEGVVTSLSQTGAKICVCDAKLINILVKAKALPKSLELIVTIGEVQVE